MLGIYKKFNMFLNDYKDAANYIKKEKNAIISERVISKIYKSIRYILYRYLYLSCQHGLLIEENSNKFCSINQSLFTNTKKGKAIMKKKGNLG